MNGQPVYDPALQQWVDPITGLPAQQQQPAPAPGTMNAGMLSYNSPVQKPASGILAQNEQPSRPSPEDVAAARIYSAAGSTLGGLTEGHGDNSLSGGLEGAGQGAAIGTMIAPGIGTAIGAGVGAVAGAVGAEGKSDSQRTREQMEKIQLETMKQQYEDYMTERLLNRFLQMGVGGAQVYNILWGEPRGSQY